MAKKQSNKRKVVEKKEPKVLLADDDSSSEEEEIVDESNVASEEEDEALPEEEEEKQETDAVELAFKSDGRYHNKQRCLTLSSRNVTSRYRHLLEDLRTLIPHNKRESKLDADKTLKGGIGAAITDIAEMRGCNSVLFLECRKRKDAYMWLGHTKSSNGNGPSAKFLVENVHTMDELRLTGNCMKGSRPILTFDSNFDEREELKLLKCLFTDVFGTPRGHPKSKPFVDRVMGFYYADKKIWIRNYQIMEDHAANAKEAHEQKKAHGKAMATSLAEIGPRFVLNPIRIFRGAFGGQTLYKNDQYISPNVIRSMENQNHGNTYTIRKDAQKKRKTHVKNIVVPEDPLASVFK
uniref:Brix domain-containing protein n=1 Tax=Chaetoceros debilis TaxID=122233 RepID=A0A7S3Q0T3_9STRA|eukprot:CAMPEP_0194079576 /NCGR_PEP_ID=MMETSP0149-20130528/5748_1 /TAXON_ID=122233 /ORGANISM="Chaetoceros debilis, Strain MM31A-1" /LENGTH=349 /DNA_ID=CAMNT_0038761101 /DNA_START=71 /DNA_END=1120 /DNA_ORIENTATION=+